jgi:hypothetical protein
MQDRTIRHVVLLRGVSNLHWQINPRISASANEYASSHLWHVSCFRTHHWNRSPMESTWYTVKSVFVSVRRTVVDDYPRFQWVLALSLFMMTNVTRFLNGSNVLSVNMASDDQHNHQPMA